VSDVPKEREVRLYITEAGHSPFAHWFDHLRDALAQHRILARIARLRTGNAGDYKNLGGGVCEMRIDYGPGYRIYYGQQGSEIVILLIGGDKRTQTKDIENATRYWNEHKEKRTSTKF
jgi:putative addiction module killer protein